jgi:hypothetical protein
MKRITVCLLSVTLIFGSIALAYVPNDPGFKKQIELFGPGSTETYINYSLKYNDNDPRNPKHKKGDSQPSGSSVDLAWDIEKGDPSVVIAILDTGATWSNEDLRYKWNLNKGELINYAPDWDPVSFAPIWDVQRIMVKNGNGKLVWVDKIDIHKIADGIFNVKDYEYAVMSLNPDKPAHIRLLAKYMAENDVSRLTPQDLIRVFSDGIDDDNNGFVDDICGWDFFEDDNDPEDVSSYSAAEKHGNGQAEGAGAEQDNGTGGSGVCPGCMIMPLKTWDSFVQDTNYFGIGSLYAARNGANVLEGALGGLNNSGICKAAFKEAYDKWGLVLFMVSSDINSANHNFPTYLNEPVYCSGTVSDAYPLPENILKPTTYFRNSNLCQFGSKNQINFEVPSGSQSTSLSSGAGGLLISHAKRMRDTVEGREKLGIIRDYKNGMPLHPDQIKQLITLTCEDVLPENGGSIGSPDASQFGWDQHFGYGRVNLYHAIKALDEGLIPPVVRITSPSWNHYLDPRKDRLVIRGDVLPGVNGNSGWIIEAAQGIEPLEDKFVVIARGNSTGTDIELANIDLSVIKKIFNPGMDFSYYPNTPDEKQPTDANIQANRHMFTIRIRANEQMDSSYYYPYLYPEDRRTMFIHEDKKLHEGWPKYIGVGGDASPRFEDLDGDNLKEVIIATSDGRILIFRHDGTPYTVNGKAIEFAADEFSISARHNMRIEGTPFRQTFVTPSIADIDNDGIKEIVAVAGEKLYCFKATGERQFEPKDFSANFYKDVADGKINKDNPLGAGSMAAPVLFDLDGDGKKEIIVGSGDQRLYAWHSDGSKVRGWPVYAKGSSVGGKIIYSPCVADINSDGKPELIVATNEAVPRNGKKSSLDLSNVPSAFFPFVLDVVSSFISKNCMIYAIRNTGALNGMDGQRADSTAFVSGWPVAVESLMPDILPQLGPSSKPVAFDYDNDGSDEVVASFTAAKTTIIDGDGKILKEMDQGPMGKNAVGIRDKTLALNFFDSIALGDINGDGKPEIIKGGVTLLAAANLGLAGMNLPYNQIIQVWDPKTGKFLDAFPRTIDDYVMYSEPAAADVDGDAIPDIISGSGLYLVHAFGSNGMDKTGFPKLSAGWVMTTPAVDDIDNDGLNELAVVTREGWIFVWDTDGKYSEKPSWPTYGHDNMTTSNLKYDGIAPAAVTSYKWEDGEMQFKCPGDDGYNGKAKSISIYGYSEPINLGNISRAVLVKQITPITGGKTVYVKMSDDYAYYAVITKDEAGNTSQLPISGGIGGDGKLVLDESASGDDGGGGGGLCFINSAINL